MLKNIIAAILTIIIAIVAIISNSQNNTINNQNNIINSQNDIINNHNNNLNYYGGSHYNNLLQRTDISYNDDSNNIDLKSLLNNSEKYNTIIHHNDNYDKNLITKQWSKLPIDGYYIICILSNKLNNTIVDKIMNIMTYLESSKYLGSEHYNDNKYYIWQKVSKNIIPDSADNRDLWNPNIIIKEYDGFKVISDDILLGGTKQRGAIDLLNILPEKEFVYVGPYTGFAQVALALSAKLNNKIATLFIQKHRPMMYQTKLAIQLGATIYEFSKNQSSLFNMRKIADKYVKKQNNKHTTRMFMLGFQEQEFIDCLTKSLKKAIAKTPLANPEFNGTIWLTGGSAVLTRLFYKLFPKAKINVVQIGKEIDWYIDRERSDFYIAPEKFFEPAQIIPPYPSVPEYDAKLWRFVLKHGKPGDYIWNVAGVPN